MARLYLRLHYIWDSIIYGVPLPENHHYLWRDFICNVSIDQFQKSQNAPVPYTTMHQFVTEMCTYKMVHYGIFVWCIMGFVRWVSSWFVTWTVLHRDVLSFSMCGASQWLMTHMIFSITHAWLHCWQQRNNVVLASIDDYLVAIISFACHVISWRPHDMTKLSTLLSICVWIHDTRCTEG